MPPLLQAQMIESYTFTTNRVVPDGNAAGLSDVRNIASVVGSITAITVHLKLTGEYNGDLYAYLRHSNGFTVLLNRPGKTTANAYGYPDSGSDVALLIGATNGDVHVYQNVTTPSAGSPLTGAWEPDGRTADPTNVTTISPQSTSLTNFNGLNAAGQWTLYLADMESGGTNMLTEWGLDITGAASPTLTWSAPAEIVYGTALGAAQLNATATHNSTNVPGTLAYSPAAGTVLNAGTGQTLSVTFMPADTISFLSISTNVLINVLQAPLTITANDTNKVFGAALPTFTASYSGFANGDTAASLSTPVTLGTTATASSPVGAYSITASGAASANYSITEINGTLTVYGLNQPPVLATISNAIVLPDGFLGIRLQAWDVDGDQLMFKLGAGAPFGASITNYSSRELARLSTNGPPDSTNVLFSWSPTRAYASTTNLITVLVTDNGSPPLSATQSFTVIVQDYLELTVGSTNAYGGQSVGVPINLASSDGVTNLLFNMPWPAGQFTNATLAVTAQGIASGSLQDQITNFLIEIHLMPGHVLQGTQQIAQLSFLAVSNQHSAFVPLPIGSVIAAKPDASDYSNYIPHAGLVAVVRTESLLEAAVSTDQSRYLALFGRLGVRYQLQYSTNLAIQGNWRPLLDYLQTNIVMTIDMDSSNPTIFYRLLQP